MEKHFRRTGRLFVISAPSGAGKSTLIARIRPMFPDMRYSVSCTTRPARQGEVDGVDYRFLSKPHFMEMVNRCEFLEWKEVHGNLYGTAVTPILQAVEAGRPVILDIDVEGAKEVFSKHASAVGIFIKPPNLAALEQRLRGRGTDSGDAIGLRIKNAEREMEAASEFKYQVVNDDLESAVNELADIIRKEWTHENDAPGEFGKERPLD